MVRFEGLLGRKEKLDHEKALAAKTGQVIEAEALVRDISAGSKTLKIDYPRGCAVRVKGVLHLKGATRSDLAGHLGAFQLRLKCADGSEAVCYTDDRELYERAVAERGVLGRPIQSLSATGTVLTLQGTLDNEQFPDREKIQLSVSKANEVRDP